jgi:sirohydrochlorin ferrochelatase
MAAPALVMLTHGSTDPAVTEVAHHLRYGLQTVRPTLEVNAAFIDGCPPTGPQVVSHLIGRGIDEIAFVPLQLSAVTDHDPSIDTVVERVRAAHPAVRFAVARPLGPEACLLGPLDERLRAALGTAHATEIDGLVLSAEGPSDVRGLGMLSRRARQWGAHHKLPCVLAMSDGSSLNVAAAIESLNAQGRRHVAVGSFYLAPDADFDAQARLALRVGAIAASAPIGVDDAVLDLILARYAFAAMDLLDDTEDDSLQDYSTALSSAV